MQIYWLHPRMITTTENQIRYVHVIKNRVYKKKGKKGIYTYTHKNSKYFFIPTGNQHIGLEYIFLWLLDFSNIFKHLGHSLETKLTDTTLEPYWFATDLVHQSKRIACSIFYPGT